MRYHRGSLSFCAAVPLRHSSRRADQQICNTFFFALGNLAGPTIRVVIERVSRKVSSRLEIGPADPERPGRESGVVLRRDQLARSVPYRPHMCGWLSTIARWDAEHHQVTIELERDVVSDVQARVRRTRVAEPDKV